ncbi:MAG: hypothetical protein WCK11_05565 [Candidatus Falkowbacteria bacterium]
MEFNNAFYAFGTIHFITLNYLAYLLTHSNSDITLKKYKNLYFLSFMPSFVICAFSLIALPLVFIGGMLVYYSNKIQLTFPQKNKNVFLILSIIINIPFFFAVSGLTYLLYSMITN